MTCKEPRKRCVWCNQLDYSVGKVMGDDTTCLSCEFIRLNLKHMAETSRGREFLHEILASASEMGESR